MYKQGCNTPDTSATAFGPGHLGARAVLAIGALSVAFCVAIDASSPTPRQARQAIDSDAAPAGGYSPLAQITPRNASGLRELCRVKVGHAAPVAEQISIAGQAILVRTAQQTVAINASTCETVPLRSASGPRGAATASPSSVDAPLEVPRAQGRASLAFEKPERAASPALYRSAPRVTPGRLCALRDAESGIGPTLDEKTGNFLFGASQWCALDLARRGGGRRGQSPETPARGYVGTPDKWITAISADSGRIVWRYEADEEVQASVTPTAGGVTFAGDIAGNFLVLDSKYGALLAKTRMGNGFGGRVITYQLAGMQYVAMLTGQRSQANRDQLEAPTIVVMGLGERSRGLDLLSSLDRKSLVRRGEDVTASRALFGQANSNSHFVID